jgi:hypothetical protein
MIEEAVVTTVSLETVRLLVVGLPKCNFRLADNPTGALSVVTHIAVYFFVFSPFAACDKSKQRVNI